MNTKKVRQAFDKVVKRLLEMPSEDFKDILKREKGDIAHIFLEGGLVGNQNKDVADEELLGCFPDAGEIQSSYTTFSHAASYNADDSFYDNNIRFVKVSHSMDGKEGVSVTIDKGHTPQWVKAA